MYLKVLNNLCLAHDVSFLLLLYAIFAATELRIFYLNFLLHKQIKNIMLYYFNGIRNTNFMSIQIKITSISKNLDICEIKLIEIFHFNTVVSKLQIPKRPINKKTLWITLSLYKYFLHRDF